MKTKQKGESQSQNYKKKTKLVDEKFNDLFTRTERDSFARIKISLDMETHNLSIAVAQKSSFLTYNRITISQQNKVENRKIPNIVSNDVAVQ